MLLIEHFERADHFTIDEVLKRDRQQVACAIARLVVDGGIESRVVVGVADVDDFSGESGCAGNALGASKRMISSLPSATFDQSSIFSRSRRKMLARSASSSRAASLATRSNSAPKSLTEFICWQMVRMAESLSCNWPIGILGW